mmetsp:Transcript_70240/g.228374  ORF Transcript_70240/g.228374 Transcript_70240/m.228374 type:complete len:214 (-) Transcript_70240:46-687(-)
MNRLFGAAKAQPKASGPAPSLTDASGRIDSRVSDLDVKIQKCDADIRRYMTTGSGSQQKQLAMQTMKRKKMYEQQRDQILATQFNIDMLAGAQEQAELTAMTVEAMGAGTKDLRQRFAAMGGAVDIEGMMDDMADLHDEMSEINEALATSYTVPQGFDEGAFEAEFSALEEEMALEKLIGAGPAASAMPDYLAAPPAATAAGATPAAAGPASS